MGQRRNVSRQAAEMKSEVFQASVFTLEVVFDPTDEGLARQELLQTGRLLLGDRGELPSGVKQVVAERHQGPLLKCVFLLLNSQG